LLADDNEREVAGEDSRFVAHRHDQSILTLLAALRRCQVFREPSQYGIWTREAREAYIVSPEANQGLLNESCPQVLDVHRGRNRSHPVVWHLWRMRRKIAGARRGASCI